VDSIAFLIAPAATLLMCLVAAPLGRALGVLDRPDGVRKLHARETPMVGGLAVMLPTLAAAAVLAVSDFAPFFLVFLGVVLTGTVLGFMDDRRHIPALLRLGVAVAAVLALISAVPGLRVDVLAFGFLSDLVLLGPILASAFTVLCLVGLQNAVNMADGKNGLVPGMALIWCLILLAHAPAPIVPLLGVLATCLAVVLAFNVTGRLFLGDAGTYGISFAIGIAALYVYSVNFASFRAETAALLFLVPVVDTLRLMVVRTLAGRSPFASDRCHFHHILLELMPWHWGLAVYLGLVAIPSLLARYFPDWALLCGVATLAIYGVIASLRYRVALAQPLPRVDRA
jgi:UDP-GlcNAc:undecaprenyl-phosphate GlcNAc-1-phosphate transferase